ncbi:MAG: hypothetical protein VX612_09330, partial [Pseudomonadota bacterium]|nr:hypothetical protein [Pseudomonadota bacterium]
MIGGVELIGERIGLEHRVLGLFGTEERPERHMAKAVGRSDQHRLRHQVFPLALYQNIAPLPNW